MLFLKKNKVMRYSYNSYCIMQLFQKLLKVSWKKPVMNF